MSSESYDIKRLICFFGFMILANTSTNIISAGVFFALACFFLVYQLLKG